MDKKPNVYNPKAMQPILEEMAGLLSRFSLHDHRKLEGKNVIPGTGCFVKQNRAMPCEYIIIFYTPDDIPVQARINLKLVFEDAENQINQLLIGVSRYIQLIRTSKNPHAAMAAGVIH